MKDLSIKFSTGYASKLIKLRKEKTESLIKSISVLERSIQVQNKNMKIKNEREKENIDIKNDAKNDK